MKKTKSKYQAAREERAKQAAQEQADFDAARDATITHIARDEAISDQIAARWDTHNAEFPTDLAIGKPFDFVTPNWNDADDQQVYPLCRRIIDEIRSIEAEKKLSDTTLRDFETLLNCSFSERIKMHIVELVAGTETIEGACRHCFGLYGLESNNRELGTSMAFWHELGKLINDAFAFRVFKERATHLTPTSPYFPERFRPLVEAVQEKAQAAGDKPTYANPYRQMELLNETLKQLAYTARHTTNPTELAKLANSQVRVAGALHVINAKLDREHQHAIDTARQYALQEGRQTS